MSLTLFVLMSLAAFRVTRLIVADKLTEGLRDRLNPEGGWAYFVTCYWCAGAWVSVLVVLTVDVFDVSVPLPGLQVLAVSSVVGLIGANLD